MPVERWGAFSVIDYKDAKKLAAEVLLYDRLVIPMPMDWDIPRWIKNKWINEEEAKQLTDRLKQLGDIAIPAAWDQDAQNQWKQKFDALSEDVRDINSALEMTRRVLVDQARKYRPEGVSTIEAFSAYQSEADFQKRELGGHPPQPMAEFDFLVAERIAIPNEEDPEESLKRALGILDKKDFRERRSRFHDWQHNILARGILPQDAARDLPRLVGEYNDIVRGTGRSYRVETAMLVGSLGAVALGAMASLAPALFISLGIGVLGGAKVVSIGTAATGGILQIAKHVRGRRDPDSTTRAEVSGAMFHQIEEETGWTLRVGPE